jgi:hypothetical protein
LCAEAAAVLMLANDGRLSLDDEARKYVPQLPDFGVPITIRRLMHRFPARSIALSGYACGTGRTHVVMRVHAE